MDVYQLHRQVLTQRERNDLIEKENAVLIANVENLKQGYEIVEEQARVELGMVKSGETFYRYI